MGFHLITCIVERGRADKVVNEAVKAGAQAATFFYARGKGLREKLGFLGTFIAPEKEVIMIVTKEEQTDAVFNTIVEAAKLNTAGKGFAFIQKVEKSVGFIEM
jgi:nitrogen regulatory protein PII